jgi:prevent-host-death family protein
VAGCCCAGLENRAILRYLVSVTRKSKSGAAKASGTGTNKSGRRPAHRDASTGRWLLQDAKARFSELVRRVKTDGPQLVTVHGREEVVVVAADEYRRLKGEVTGQALIDMLQASPHRDVEIAPPRAPVPVRDVNL